MSSAMHARRAAVQASSSVFFDVPAMLKEMLLGKSSLPCRTAPIWLRTERRSRLSSSLPSRSTFPESAVKAEINLMSVNFPQPEGPTMATNSPRFMSSETWSRMRTSSSGVVEGDVPERHVPFERRRRGAACASALPQERTRSARPSGYGEQRGQPAHDLRVGPLQPAEAARSRPRSRPRRCSPSGLRRARARQVQKDGTHHVEETFARGQGPARTATPCRPPAAPLRRRRPTDKTRAARRRRP